jgi:2Fe-2S ferredoxin
VFVDPAWYGKLPGRHSDELELLESTECFRDGQSRLACQVKVTDALDGIKLTVAPEE